MCWSPVPGCIYQHYSHAAVARRGLGHSVQSSSHFEFSLSLGLLCSQDNFFVVDRLLLYSLLVHRDAVCV